MYLLRWPCPIGLWMARDAVYSDPAVPIEPMNSWRWWREVLLTGSVYNEDIYVKDLTGSLMWQIIKYLYLLYLLRTFMHVTWAIMPRGFFSGCSGFPQISVFLFGQTVCWCFLTWTTSTDKKKTKKSDHVLEPSVVIGLNSQFALQIIRASVLEHML